MKAVLELVRRDLQDSVDEKTKATFHRFFKEEVLAYGVKTATVEKIARQHWKEISQLEKSEIFTLCDNLLSSGYCEEVFVVSNWLPGLVNQFVKQDIFQFRTWIEKYIDNWAKCDGFCNHTVGGLVMKFPQCLDELKNWARTPHRWLKRAAAVTLIIPAKRGAFLQTVFEIATILLCDPDDMVQKGYGWMLKETSRLHQQEVFQFVMEHKKQMPRTALRYAIELMSDEMRKVAMLKDW